ncbi:MAG: ATP-dependent Clp protease adaptor ClpS [Verrucomicrobia bacterium]|nr:ATP-dependent Clp protease adaptor ClpS [Verrucomicrobiota bacterium]
MSIHTVQNPIIEVATEIRREELYEVILHNDDFSPMLHVVTSLMKVFDHSRPLAIKIMDEAHMRGQAVAEVESRRRASLHRNQLLSLGLSVTLNRI